MASTILIYGRGKVGQSLARFCDTVKQKYVLCDDSDAPESFDAFKYIVPSPGVPSGHPIYQSGKIKSELDFLFPYLPEDFQVHAVTGTDGKSTTSWILYHFLKLGFDDQPVYLGGNFGTPFAEVLMEIFSKNELSGHIVLEVSSFMGYHLETFGFTNTILTNFHPDHLDWHKDVEEYLQAKMNLLGHTKELIIYPESVLKHYPEIDNFPIKSLVLETEAMTVSSDNLLAITPEVFIDVSDRQLLGDHNIANIFFAASLAYRLGLTAKTLSSILPNIPALSHRLQRISEQGGRIWIDDSKSTTAQSLFAALAAFAPHKVHLIAGGKDKHDPFTGLTEKLKEHCASCVAIGETKGIFLQAAHEAYVPCESAMTMSEAVSYIRENTKEGDIILLSPGCSSLDMFANYEERASQFALAINAGE